MRQIDKQSQSILVRIRNNEIEVNENRIRLNKRIVPVQDITGIRCNRITCCIEIRTCEFIPIKIECKRFLRAEQRALNDFECIVAALKRLLTPKIALQIANHVFLGNNFDINTFSKFTHEGLWMTHVIIPGVPVHSKEKQAVETIHSQPTSSYENSFVPYDELEFRQLGNWLEIGPKAKPKFVYQQIDDNAWNALIIENIAKNIIMLIHKKSELNRN